MGSCFGVLKKWKTTSGRLFDRRVLNPELPSLQALKSIYPKPLIVPIPQKLKRSWSLRGSPALKIASWLASQLGGECVLALGESNEESNKERKSGSQASLSHEVRFLERSEFKLTREAKLIEGRTVLIVDDFMTSGRTLKLAAKCLARQNPLRISAFALGIRPDLGTQSPLNLTQSLNQDLFGRLAQSLDRSRPDLMLALERQQTHEGAQPLVLKPLQDHIHPLRHETPDGEANGSPFQGSSL